MEKVNSTSFQFSRCLKICFVLLFLILPGILKGFSQDSTLDKEIKLKERNTTLKIYLDELSKKGGFVFSYGQHIRIHKKIKIESIKQSVRKHLDYMFAGESLQFIEKGRKILIVPSKEKNPKAIPTQNIKGRVVDIDSKLPMNSVNIVLDSIGSFVGTTTDEFGFFKIENVPVGRHNLRCFFVGYEPKSITNFMVASGKEFVVTVEMEESVVKLPEVEVKATINKSRPINNLALVSGRSFSSSEIENYPGSISDISRTALSFPGVISTNDGQNHIVIRGNSPKGLQWRLEGVEIPNLNHFSEIGASGGGVNVISNNIIGSSDFLTSAFPAEYGNAISGVFDLRLRSGNNEKHEQTFQVGMLGTEVMVEGPLNKSTNTTYLAQFRYATLRMIQQLGFPLKSVPDFQDLAFKIYHPTKKLGVFSLFGIGGLSHEVGESGYDWNSDLLTVGLSNNFTFNSKTHLKSVLSYSGWKYNWDDDANIGTAENPIDRIWKTKVSDQTLKASLNINRKISAKHKVKAGLVYEKAFNNSFMGWHSDTLFNRFSNTPGSENIKYQHTYVDSRVNAGTFQSFLNWKFKVNDALTFNSGIHYLQFFLNNSYSVEPRFGFQWMPHEKHILSGGFGKHSRKESLTLYTGQLALHDGEVIQANKDLELTKANHYVLGYKFLISDNLHLKAEAYYQDLYDIPAYPFPPYFSSINFDYGFEGNILTNHGTAYNKGIELSLEKFHSKGYYFLLNGTVYESKYRNKPGELLHTKYNGKFATNGLVGKEFNLGSEKQNILSLSSRYIYAGGMRQLPIDEEQSLAQGRQVNVWDNGFTEKASDYFRIDFLIKFTRNRPKYSSEWSLDITNLTNNKNLLKQYWDNSSGRIKKEYQNQIIPFITYRIQF